MDNNDFIGVYLSPTRIEAVQFNPEENDFVAFFTTPLPEGIISPEGAILNPEDLADQLKLLWAQSGLQVKQIVLGVQSAQVVCHLVTLPRIPLNQLGHAILSEAEQFALFRDEELIIDYIVTNVTDDFVTVCYAAASKKVIQGYRQVARLARLQLQGLDLAQMAGLRGMEFYFPEGQSAWTGAQIIANKSLFTVWQEGVLTTLREMTLPQNTFEQEALIEFLQSEILRTQSSAALGENAALVLSHRSLAESIDLTAAMEAAGIALTSPGCDVWHDRLSEANLANISHIALGTALYGRGTAVPSFNLLKQASDSGLDALFQTARGIVRNSGVIAACTLLLVVAGLEAAGGYFYWRDLEEKATRSKLKFQRLQAETEQYKKAASVYPMPEQKLLDSWIPNREEDQFVYSFLGVARSITPSNAWLSKIQYENSAASGSVMVFEGGATDQAATLYFVNQLSELDSVRFVQLRRLVREGETYNFAIQASLQRVKKQPLL